MSPENTKAAPNHCRPLSAFPKKMTEPRTVKNFRVVVAMEQGSGPNSVTHMKMKYWPRAEATEKVASWPRTAGCRWQKLMNSLENENKY